MMSMLSYLRSIIRAIPRKIIASSRKIIIPAFILSALSVHAQPPVQVTPQLIPPYTLQLSDYYSGTQEKLVVILTNRDLTKPAISIYLRMTISGQSATIHTRDNVYYPPIILDAGIPTRLSLSDLAPYFNPNNLDFQGITKAQYQQSGKLPEGFYQFCFEAVEQNTGRVVSQNSCAMAWISLSDPPLLNLPAKAENVAFRDPQNILFTWTPRNLNSPNSAFSTEYDFQLVEIMDTTIDPSAAFQMSQPLYETTTATTTLLYGPGQPSLLTGKKYAWRVQAKAKSGADDVDLFRNNGYSEIYWFLLQDNCQAPQQASAIIQNGGVHISWTEQPGMLNYEVDYRAKDQTDANWFTQLSSSDSVVLYDVTPGKNYEYRIGGACSVGGGITYGDIQGFTVPAQDTIGNKNCGILPNINIANQNPLQALNAGDVFLAGDFPVKVQTASGKGSYTGNGYVTVPFLGEARVKVTFSNIGINTDLKMISGVVVTTFDSTEKQVVNTDTVAQMVKELVNDIGVFLDSYKGTDQDKEQAAIYHQKLDSLAATVINNPDLPDSIKQPLLAAQTAAQPALKNLETATPCPDSTAVHTTQQSGGPSVSFFDYDPDYSCNKSAVQQYAAATANGVEQADGLLSKQTPRVFCISADNATKLKGSIFIDPDGHPVDIGDATPYAFYSSQETDVSLVGRLYAIMKDGILYAAYFDDTKANDEFYGYGTIPGSGKEIQWAKTSRAASANAQLLINDPNCNISIKVNGQVVDAFSQSNCRQCSAWPQAYTEKSPTYPNPYDDAVGKLIVEGIQIAAAKVDLLLASGNISPALTDGIKKDLATAIQAADPGNAALLQKIAGNYFGGLASMAAWRASDYQETKKDIIDNSNLDNFRIITVVDLRIKASIKEQLEIVSTAAETASFISSLALFPDVGAGPKGPRINSQLQQQIVDLAATKVATKSVEYYVGVLSKNATYKALYDNLVSGANKRMLQEYAVTMEEEAALKFYTTDEIYGPFSRALGGDIPMTEEFAALKELMTRAVDKLPGKTGIIFRGAGKTESAFAAKLNINEVFDFGGRFTSGSFDQSLADLFRRGKGGNAIWKIQSKTGVDITSVNINGESEALFKPLTKYKLVNKYPDPSDASRIIYEIVEQ